MIKRCFILSIEPYNPLLPEECVIKMFKMFITTLRIFGGRYKDIPVYVGVFSDMFISDQDLSFCKKNNVTVEHILEYKELTHKKNNLVIGRHLVADYFGKRLLPKYDELIYIDVDVLVLNEPVFPNHISSNIMTDIISLDYWQWEKEYAKYDLIHSQLKRHVPYTKYYSQWIGNINSQNLRVYLKVVQRMYDEMKLHDNRYPRWGSVIFNEIIKEDNIQIIDVKEYSAIMPYRDLWTNDSSIIHYDSVNKSGYLYQLFNLDSKKKKDMIRYCIQQYNITLESSFIEQAKKIKDEESREWFLERIKKDAI